MAPKQQLFHQDVPFSASFDQKVLYFHCGKDGQKKIFYNQSQNSCQGIKEKKLTLRCVMVNKFSSTIKEHAPVW
jgi:hypothetical protein